MKVQSMYRPMCMLLCGILLFSAAGCANVPSLSEPSPSPAPVTSAAPTETPEVRVKDTPAAEPVSNADVLYQDDFTNPATAWPEDKFDNYFIGYHEPEYYHVEITGSNYRTTVFAPEKQTFGDATIELQVMTASSKTAASGDFRYGLSFHRSGDQYYAFTISPRTKKWYVLKSSPNGLTVLKEGTDNEIHELDTDDALRVDLNGPDFTFYINEQFVGEVSDSDYASGEIGFYVESFDSPNTHIHFDNLVIRNLEVAQLPQTGVTLLYQDDFTNPASSWPERKFDNYFIGYHEPEYYHVEITGPNYKTTVFEPQKRSFDDATIELQVMTASSKTAPTGDFRYGLVFRRSGDLYYAFTISPRTKKWYVLKSSPNALSILKEGTNQDIHDLDTDDLLRVDAQGSSFIFHINDELVAQVTDLDYAAGEVGFYVESFDSPNTHIHFDDLSIREFQVSVICDVRALALNVRSAPGTNNSSTTFLSSGDTVEPLGRTEDSEWIKIKVAGGETEGWIFNSDEFLSCQPSVELLPVTSP